MYFFSHSSPSNREIVFGAPTRNERGVAYVTADDGFMPPAAPIREKVPA